MAAALATQPDVEAVLQRALTATEAGYIATQLAKASAAVRSYARQTFTLVTDDVVDLRGTWADGLVLPERPVTAVTAVAMQGDPLDTVEWHWPGKDILLRGPHIPNGRAEPRRGWDWGGPRMVITVTYSHGYATIPDDVVSATAEVAARNIAVPVGVSSEQVGSYSVQYGNKHASGFVLIDAERELLKPYRRAVA